MLPRREWLQFYSERYGDELFGLPIYEGSDISLLAVALDGIALPIAKAHLLIDDDGAFVDEFAMGNEPSSIPARQSFASFRMPVAKVCTGIRALTDFGIEMLVDRLMRDMPVCHSRMVELQYSYDLFMREIFPDPPFEILYERGIPPLRPDFRGLVAFLCCKTRMMGEK